MGTREKRRKPGLEGVLMTDWLEPHVAGVVETMSQWCEVFQPVNICAGMCCEFRHSIGFVNTAESIH